MSDFYDEIKEEYPELFDKKQKPVRKRKKQSLGKFLTPMVMMAYFMLGALIILSLKSSSNYDNDYYYIVNRIKNLEERVAKNEQKIKTSEIRIHMLGVLHNENWTIYKTGKCRGNVMFIESEDHKWYIENMPRFIYVDKESKNYIEENYLGKPANCPFNLKKL